MDNDIFYVLARHDTATSAPYLAKSSGKYTSYWTYTRELSEAKMFRSHDEIFRFIATSNIANANSAEPFSYNQSDEFNGGDPLHIVTVRREYKVEYVEVD